MKINIKTLAACVALGLSFSVVSSLSGPADARGFNLLGGDLAIGQRDFRIFNNFSDSEANNNNTPHANYPGAFGADMTIWKAHTEWGSEVYAGNGAGDPIQTLGNGGANFDNIYQGSASSIGDSNSNIHAELIDSSPGGTLAFMQGPISNGWMIRYLSFWTWKDGPGGVNSTPGGTGYDLQNIATHEIGHALGLDHSNSGSATMWPSAGPGSESGRSISADDINGIKAVYGAKSAGKPKITSLSGQTGPGGVLTIHGTGFSTDLNVIYFTKANSDGVPSKVNMISSTNGGTRVNVTIPPDAIDGEVHVKIFATGHDSLTNAWPIDITAPISDPPNLSSANPGNGPLGGGTDVTLSGSGFGGTTSVTFGGVAASFSVDSANEITATSPAGAVAGPVNITVTDPDGSDTLTNGFSYDAPAAPGITLVLPGTGPTTGGTAVSIIGTNMSTVDTVTFGGVAAAIQSTTAGSVSVLTPLGFGVVDVFVSSPDGNDTLGGGFLYTGGGSFTDLGPGVAGSLGMPSFTGSGDLTPGSAVGYSTTLSNVPGGVPAFLFLSLTQSALPFKGGTFYPFPVVATASLTVPGSGMVSLPHAIDASTPGGLDIIAQWWMSDPSGPLGATGSNGLELAIP